MSDITRPLSTCHNPVGAAEYLRIPAAPAYSDPKGDFLFGANFASSGATTVAFHTNQSGVSCETGIEAGGMRTGMCAQIQKRMGLVEWGK